MYTLIGKSWDIPDFVIWTLGHVHSSREIPGLSWNIPNLMIWTLGHVHSSREIPGLSWNIPNLNILTLGHVHSNKEILGLSWNIPNFVIWYMYTLTRKSWDSPGISQALWYGHLDMYALIGKSWDSPGISLIMWHLHLRMLQECPWILWQILMSILGLFWNVCYSYIGTLLEHPMTLSRTLLDPS